MDFFIKKIFNGEKDELVHLQFQKFSRGEFKGRALITAKNSGSKFSINTTYEYGNEFVRFLAEKLGPEKTKVTGVIVSTKDLDRNINFSEKKQFMGVKQYIIENEMSGDEILNLCDKLKNSFIGLSFNIGDTELKIKPKAPKSGKPSTKAEDKKANFCKVKTSNQEIINSLIFDGETKNFKQIEISHDFIINEIIIPDELKNEKDYAVIKEGALRKGKVIRKIKVDGKEINKEKEFVA